ncbi:hypothetical protein OESDEN_11539 [Oesophagostomum dentatum]|uniref:Uncharacterized protein n=1 Tax=Oesophagostomum dentatum TaxID=61180 RepID=A0A0B1SXR2_OESDE|nr:hypothetical protein OESDEN_11539 [Oesophagostomum dentatum]
MENEKEEEEVGKVIIKYYSADELRKSTLGYATRTEEQTEEKVKNEVKPVQRLHRIERREPLSSFATLNWVERSLEPKTEADSLSMHRQRICRTLTTTCRLHNYLLQFHDYIIISYHC